MSEHQSETEFEISTRFNSESVFPALSARAMSPLLRVGTTVSSLRRFSRALSSDYLVSSLLLCTCELLDSNGCSCSWMLCLSYAGASVSERKMAEPTLATDPCSIHPAAVVHPNAVIGQVLNASQGQALLACTV